MTQETPVFQTISQSYNVIITHICEIISLISKNVVATWLIIRGAREQGLKDEENSFLVTRSL